MRILFAGSSDIATPTLEAIASRFEVGAVLTNTDKPGPRSKRPVPSPVKAKALELGLPVIQFDRLGRAARTLVAQSGCDTLLCFAYGRIFGPKFLNLFEREKLNIHPSLLPLLRGPSPIQGAILNGASETGISIQQIALEMDSGDLLSVETVPLVGDETSESLSALIAERAAPLAIEALMNVAQGTAVFTPQIGSPTYTTLINSTMAQLDFTLPAAKLHAQIRAMIRWPKGRTTFNGQTLFLCGVHGTLAEAGSDPVEEGVAPGTVLRRDRRKGVGIATGDGILWVTHLQLEKRKELDALSFLNGNQDFIGSRLG